MASKSEKVEAVAYIRTSSTANVGADKDSDKRQRAAIDHASQQISRLARCTCPSIKSATNPTTSFAIGGAVFFESTLSGQADVDLSFHEAPFRDRA